MRKATSASTAIILLYGYDQNNAIAAVVKVLNGEICEFYCPFRTFLMTFPVGAKMIGFVTVILRKFKWGESNVFV